MIQSLLSDRLNLAVIGPAFEPEPDQAGAVLICAASRRLALSPFPSKIFSLPLTDDQADLFLCSVLL